MKKLLYFVAVATFALFSCQNDDDPINNESKKPITFKATLEEGTTRGTINGSNGLVWTTGDKIGIYFASWENNNHQSFTLSNGAGTTQGEFTKDFDWDFSASTATVAFFPWQGTGSDKNNVYDGTMYFKLPNSYSGYTSGTMLTPLIANLGGSTDVKFKHAGAAVKVTINNLPTYAKKISMSVDGKQIYGDFHINPANAGTDYLSLDNSEDASKNKIVLNFTNATVSAWTFIFPVPTLATPKLSFEILDENNIPVLSKNPKTQSTLGRGDILVMPDLTITPYDQFKKDTKTWTFSGKINGSVWTNDVPMYTDGTYWILSGKTFAAGDEFKIRKDNKWDESYPGSNWVFNSGNAGTKDIIFNSSTHEVSVVDHVCPYPTDSE